MDDLTTPLVHAVDDDASLRRALAFLLESGGWRVAVHDSAEAFLAAWAEPARPGCLILDVRMPRISGLELQRLLKERGIHLPIIFLTGHADVAIAVQAMKLGAAEFIEKPFKDQHLLDAVAQAVAKDVARHAETQNQKALRELLDKLSPRELEVARMIGEGLPNKIIGQRLSISERTVQVHRLRVMDKLGIHSAAELVHILLGSSPPGGN